jgi:hypothetical protein
MTSQIQRNIWMTWREWPLIFLYLALAWEHQFLAFYLHERTVLARQHDQLGHLDLLAVEEGVMERHSRPTMVMSYRLMNNLFPTIIDRWFWLHRHMRGDVDTRDILTWLVRRPLRYRLQNSLAN